MHDAVVSAFLQHSVLAPMSDEVLDLYLAPWRGPDGAHRFYEQIRRSTRAPFDAIQDRLDRLPVRPDVV